MTPTAHALDDWLDALSEPVPEPGGGAAAALVTAIGAALAAMTAGYAAGGERIVSAARSVRVAAVAASDADGAVSRELVAAIRSDPSDAGRTARIRDVSVRAAADSAVRGEATASLASALTSLRDDGAPALLPDVAVSAHLLAAAIRSFAVNVRCDTTLAVDAGLPAGEAHALRERANALVAAAADLDALGAEVSAGL